MIKMVTTRIDQNRVANEYNRGFPQSTSSKLLRNLVYNERKNANYSIKPYDFVQHYRV